MTLYVRLHLSILIVLLMFCGTAQAQQVNVTSVTPNPVCAGATITATYSYTQSDSGITILYLNGPNTTNIPIGAAATNGNSGSVSGVIPADRATGSYTIFIRRTSNTSGTVVNSPASSAFTVNATPPAPTVSNVAYCLGATGVPTLTATTISGGVPKWYTASSGGPAFSSVTPSTSTAGSTTYYVSQTVNGCEGPRVAQTVTINSPPAKPTVVATLSYCQNTTLLR